MRLRSCAWLLAPALGLVAMFGINAAALAGDATGTWKWTVERNGNTINRTLKLKQDGDKLTGTITGRNNEETPIDDAKVDGDSISFTVTREFNGNKFVTKYQGKLAPDTIKGDIKVERDGQTQTTEWEAKREK